MISHQFSHPGSHAPAPPPAALLRSLRPARRVDAQAYLIDWFGTYARPLLLLHLPDLQILAANDAASGLLAESLDLHQKRGRLAFGDAGAAEPFLAHVEAGGEPSPWLLRRQDGDGYMILGLTLLPTADQAEAVMVEVRASADAVEPRWGDIAAAFGLTVTEARIARKLTGRDNVQQLAADLNISLETARTHIRRIYHKAGVGSRQHLSALLRPFRLD